MDWGVMIRSKGDVMGKLLGFWGIFLLLHFAYDLYPSKAVMLISGKDESLFQHLKMAFWAYLFVSGMEYLVQARRRQQVQSFVLARLLATTLVPWYVFLLWYTAAAYYGKLPTVALEILYANIIIILVALCAIFTERNIERFDLTRSFQVVIVILFIVALSLFIIFNFQLPWADVFTESG